ncbi:MAG: hypothetical protein J0L81_04730 [Caulobacterales bacterium]|jgi:hypothetical protein|nr:hypothetical protein [Caulobacterales bacterium]
MNAFFAAMFAEMGARRRRLRASLGDRGQALVEFLVLGGLALGSLGLLLRPWMAGVSPWGFAIPVVFVIGFFLIDARRQAQLGQAEDAAKVNGGYDWVALLWSFGCALAGAAAFVIAFTSEPPSTAPEEDWAPPPSAVDIEMDR